MNHRGEVAVARITCTTTLERCSSRLTTSTVSRSPDALRATIVPPVVVAIIVEVNSSASSAARAARQRRRAAGLP